MAPVEFEFKMREDSIQRIRVRLVNRLSTYTTLFCRMGVRQPCPQLPASIGCYIETPSIRISPKIDRFAFRRDWPTAPYA